MQDQELVLRLAQLLYDRKAQDIVVLNVSGLTVLCDWMVIASGRTDNQVSSLSDAVDEFMAQEGVDIRRSEGRREGRWVILDYAPSMASIVFGTTAPMPSISPSTRQLPTDVLI